MHPKDAAQIRMAWGDKPCDHLDHTDEVDGKDPTRRAVCKTCGRSFRDLPALLADRARQRQEREDGTAARDGEGTGPQL